MLTYKEFFSWLDGYLTGKLENKVIEISPIIEKMSQVKDEPVITKIERNIYYPPSIPVNPIRREDDDLGRPPRIIM